MKRLLTVLALLAGACGATPDATRSADGIAVDPRAQRAWYAWVKAGEPAMPRDRLRGHDLDGKASWYGEAFHGRQTASGEPFDMFTMTAAHKSLPFNTVVRVMRPDTRQFVIVRINDRGPYVDGRVIDLAYGAATDLGMVRSGVVSVEIEVLAWGDGRYRDPR